MKQRELTTTEAGTLRKCIRRLKHERRHAALGATWFAIDSALGSIMICEDEGRRLDALAIALFTLAVAKGQTEEVIDAILDKFFPDSCDEQPVHYLALEPSLN